MDPEGYVIPDVHCQVEDVRMAQEKKQVSDILQNPVMALRAIWRPLRHKIDDFYECLSKKKGKLARWAFKKLLFRRYGRVLILALLNVHDRVEELSMALGNKYEILKGETLDWKAKSKFFDRSARSKYRTVKGEKPLGHTIATIREDIWKYRNWFSPEKLVKQAEMIAKNAGNPPVYTKNGAKEEEA